MPTDPIVVSADFRHSAARKWSAQFHESSSLISAILSVIHPKLYSAARQVLIRLGNQSDLRDAAAQWASVFNGVQVIGNRTTPIHRDLKSRSEWYDMLASIGPYTESDMVLRNIGVRLRYNSGTIIGIGGRLIEHGVEDFEGERICFAYFMRANVHERMRVMNSGWSTVENIEKYFINT
jgi:hypothetical protein